MTDWKSKVVYQIWPRSFQDSNGDGIGDIGGIIRRLDYLKDLGVDLLWISPLYASSNKDYGYDIDDYYQINPEFGTMEDFDRLLAEAKKRDLGIVMDLVANHTSDRHPWFQKALADPSSPYRDYYYFRPGKNGGPPNNWLSFFGGSAWTKEPNSDLYYLTTFTPNQCDLNWQNPKVRQGIYDIMRFWLDKGIAGFRMDVINTISKAEGLPDKDPEKKGLQFPGELIINRPDSHTYIKEMYREVLSHYDCLALGEGVLMTKEAAVQYTRPDREELMMLFHFDLALLGCGPLGKYDFRKFYHFTTLDFKETVTGWMTTMEREGGWIGNYLSNHDNPRQVSRFGDDRRYRKESAKALCLLDFTLRGTPFIYQGEEVGMTNCPFEKEEWRDYEAINDYQVLQDMMHLPAFVSKKIISKMTRDHARTPVQWDDGPGAGFTTGTPWIKLNPNYKDLNIAADLKSPDSLVAFYRETIAFRKAHPVLTYGHFSPILKAHRQIIGYIREDETERLLTLINLTGKKATAQLPTFTGKNALCLYHTHQKRALLPKITLAPYEGLIFSL